MSRRVVVSARETYGRRIYEVVAAEHDQALAEGDAKPTFTRVALQYRFGIDKQLFDAAFDFACDLALADDRCISYVFSHDGELVFTIDPTDEQILRCMARRLRSISGQERRLDARLLQWAGRRAQSRAVRRQARNVQQMILGMATATEAVFRMTDDLADEESAA